MKGIEKRKNKIGIGVDIEDVDRFQKLDRVKHKTFFNRVYTDKELKYCLSKKNPTPHLAARFAGKEAIYKAFYNLSGNALDYKKIEIISKKLTSPYVKVVDEKLKKFRFLISLSHTKKRAIAFAVVYA